MRLPRGVSSPALSTRPDACVVVCVSAPANPETLRLRPTFDQILEELKRIKARWSAAARSSVDSSLPHSVPLSSAGSDSSPQQHPRCGAIGVALRACYQLLWV